MTLGRSLNMQLSAEIYNVLNDDTYLRLQPGHEVGQQVNGFNEALPALRPALAAGDEAGVLE